MTSVSIQGTSMHLKEIVNSLCSTAKSGLKQYYTAPKESLPYSSRLDKAGQWSNIGHSIRYAAISQIGISKWIKYHPGDEGLLPDLISVLRSRLGDIDHIGDIALVLWAGIESGADNCDQFAKVLVQCWAKQSDSCDAVELGWVVQACTVAISESDFLESQLRPVLDDAHKRLSCLFDAKHGLFQRHNRMGVREVISRRVACFADQVYPIVAMSTYGSTFDDEASISFAGTAAEQICRYQGGLGQWEWHYDVPGGKVCEEYPVFSVHQDAMAPMAIFAADKACGVNHMKEIELGTRWLIGANELNANMVLEDSGMIWREIRRREPNKFSRKIRSLCCVLGMDESHKLTGRCFNDFVINYECRPYHLGWVLYAWADFEAED